MLSLWKKNGAESVIIIITREDVKRMRVKCNKNPWSLNIIPCVSFVCMAYNKDIRVDHSARVVMSLISSGWWWLCTDATTLVLTMRTEWSVRNRIELASDVSVALDFVADDEMSTAGSGWSWRGMDDQTLNMNGIPCIIAYMFIVGGYISCVKKPSRIIVIWPEQQRIDCRESPRTESIPWLWSRAICHYFAGITGLRLSSSSSASWTCVVPVSLGDTKARSSCRLDLSTLLVELCPCGVLSSDVRIIL